MTIFADWSSINYTGNTKTRAFVFFKQESFNKNTTGFDFLLAEGGSSRKIDFIFPQKIL